MAVETFYICDWCKTRAPSDEEGYAPEGWTDEHACGAGDLICPECVAAIEKAAAMARAEREKLGWAKLLRPDPSTLVNEHKSEEANE